MGKLHSAREHKRTGVAIAAAAALLALLLGGLLRLSAREDYWLDEGYSLGRINASWEQLYNPFAGASPEPAPPFDRRAVYDLNPPLYFALVRLVAGLEPHPEAVRLFSSLPMVLALAALAAWARRRHGTRAMLALALAGATMPAALYYGHEARPYALPLAVACLTIWLAHRWRRRPGWLLAAGFTAAAAGATMHFAFAWWIVAQFIVFAALFARARRAGEPVQARAALCGAGGLALGSLAALAVTLPELQILAQCKTATSAGLYTDVMMNTFALPFAVVGSQPVIPALGFAVQFVVFLVLLGLLRDSRRQGSGLEALGLWLVPMALPVLARLMLGAAYYERYAFFALPGWLMALAWMAGEWPRRRGGGRAAIALALGVVLALNALWLARNLGRPMRSQWRTAIATLLGQARPGECYTIDPDKMNGTFSALARRAPAAKYFSFRDGVPPEATGVWVLTETRIIREPRYDFDPAHWRVRQVVDSFGIALFHATRVVNPGGGGER